MKKIVLWGLAALCLGFTACDEVDENAAGPQVYPQLPSFNAEQLAVNTPAEPIEITLEEAVNANADIAVASYTATNYPFSEYSLHFIMQISRDANFSTFGEVEAVANQEGAVLVNAGQLQEVYYSSISKDPANRNVNVRYAAYAVNGTAKLRLGGVDKYYGEGVLSITPCPNPNKVVKAYYLIGTDSDMTIEKAVKFSHSSESIYDDPMFSVKVDITEQQANDGWQWMIISEEAFEAGNTDTPGTLFGQENEGDDYTEGTLFASTADFTPGYGVVYDFGPYLIKFNAETLGYSFMQAIETIYVPGNAQGWSPATADQLTTTDYVNYQGFAHLNGEFKFTGQPDWDPLNWGAGATNDELSMGSQTNLKAPADALYWVTFNLGSLSYKITEIQTLGLIGGFNDWGSQLNLTPSADFLVWTGTVTFAEQCEFKIRMNDNWDLNLGDDPDNLAFNAAFNLQSPAAGTYTVTVDLSKHPYTIKFN